MLKELWQMVRDCKPPIYYWLMYSSVIIPKEMLSNDRKGESE